MLALLFALVFNAGATTWHAANEAIWDVHAKRFLALEELQAAPGEILVFGEEHALPGGENDPSTAIHHDNQLRLIRQLQKSLLYPVSVGMEFLTYTLQPLVDQFLAGVLPEADFLKQVGWGANPFAFYRRQILAPRDSSGVALALNIPADVASQVAKGGKDSLTPAQKALTPPFWARGNAEYFERFAEQMKDHAPADAIERYFWAQSLWDDTMAWRALEYQKSVDKNVLVIIVGAFHVEFGGGLPFELKKNGAKDMHTVLQIETADWANSTLQDAVRSDPKYGDAADYLWLHTGAVEDPIF